MFVRASSLLQAVPHVDLHAHTTYSDGLLDVAAVVALARARGLRALGFTDHARHTSTYCAAYLDEVETAVDAYPDIRILRGLEVKITTLGGDLDLPAGLKPRLDLVVGVIHRLPDALDEERFVSFADVPPARAAALEEQATVNMIAAGVASVVGHPGRTFVERYGREFPNSVLHSIATAAASCGVAVELNARSPNLPEVLRACLDADVLIALGSDAHRTEEVGRVVHVVQMEIARLAGARPEGQASMRP